MQRIVLGLFLIFVFVTLICLLALGYFLRISLSDYIVVIFAGIFMAILLSFITSSYFIRPIKTMQATTNRIVKGDFTGKIAARLHGEFGDLAQNLNQMSDDLQNKIMEITEDRNELKAILSSMVEGVVVIGKDEKIVLLSPPVSNMLELRSRDCIGRPYWEVIRNEEIASLIKESLKSKKALKKELTVLFPAESCFDMQISPIFNEKEILAGVVAVFHDITELKKLEKLRSDFVANVSHELKTPLTSIKGFVETLRMEALDDKKTTKRFLDIIQKHAQRLENLVNDLLSLSAIESKEEELNLKSVSLSDIIDVVANLYKGQIEKKNQILTIAVPNDLPRVRVDAAKMEEVFSNLLDNAVKFTPSGGKITIRAQEGDGHIKVDVEDTGIGIPAEHLPRLFERFYRVDKSRSRELGGTGLGLAIVKHIVQAHNGKVAAQSELEKGSVFSVFLPKVI